MSGGPELADEKTEGLRKFHTCWICSGGMLEICRKEKIFRVYICLHHCMIFFMTCDNYDTYVTRADFERKRFSVVRYGGMIVRNH